MRMYLQPLLPGECWKTQAQVSIVFLLFVRCFVLFCFPTALFLPNFIPAFTISPSSQPSRSPALAHGHIDLCLQSCTTVCVNHVQGGQKVIKYIWDGSFGFVHFVFLCSVLDCYLIATYLYCLDFLCPFVVPAQ